MSETGVEPSDVSVLPRPTLGFAEKSDSIRAGLVSRTRKEAKVHGPLSLHLVSSRGRARQTADSQDLERELLEIQGQCPGSQVDPKLAPSQDLSFCLSSP